MTRVLWSASVLILGLSIVGGRTGAAEDPHAYFNALIARSDHWKSFSLRPTAGAPVNTPHYENQLLSSKPGRLRGMHLVSTRRDLRPSARW